MLHVWRSSLSWTGLSHIQCISVGLTQQQGLKSPDLDGSYSLSSLRVQNNTKISENHRKKHLLPGKRVEEIINQTDRRHTSLPLNHMKSTLWCSNALLQSNSHIWVSYQRSGRVPGSTSLPPHTKFSLRLMSLLQTAASLSSPSTQCQIWTSLFTSLYMPVQLCTRTGLRLTTILCICDMSLNNTVIHLILLHPSSQCADRRGLHTQCFLWTHIIQLLQKMKL